MALLVLGVLTLGPALAAPWRWFIGSDYLDTHGTQWFYWWFGRWLAALPDEPATYLFHPWGKDVYAHTGGNVLDALLALPLRTLLGPTLGTNVFVALVLGTNAGAAARLAAAMGADRRGQWLASALGLMQPFALFEIEHGRPTQAILAPAALALAALVAGGRRGDGLRAGAWLAVAAMVYWYQGLVACLAAAGLWFGRVVTGEGRRASARTALAAVACGALVAPFAAPMLLSLSDGGVPGLLALSDGAGPLGRLRLVTEQGDAQGLFVIDAAGRAGALIDQGGLRFQAGPRLIGPGLAALALAGLVRGRRVAAPVGFALGLTLLVAAGPLLVWGQGFLANPPYLLLVERWDVLRRWWWPGRALGVASMLGVGLAGVAVSRLGRGGPIAAVVGVTAVSLGLWGADLLPLSRWDGRVSPGIACLSTEADAVLELPYALGQAPLYHQTVHERPMLNGMLVTKAAFQPPEVVALRAGNSYVRLLVALGERDWRRERVWDPADEAAFRAFGYDTVVFRKAGFLRPRPQRDGTVEMQSDWPRAERIIADVLGSPAWQDEAVAIYALDGEFDCPGSE